MNAPIKICPRCQERERVPGRGYCAPCDAAYVRAFRADLPKETIATKICPECQGYRLADQPYCRKCQTVYMGKWRKIRLGANS